MAEDECGFLYPHIDEKKCVDCGLCLKHCAFQNGYAARKEFDPPYGFGVRHKNADVMRDSRSGGAFTALSDVILAAGGVIYGAGYDEKEGFFKVTHKRAETVRERNEFRGSKYVQSDLGNVFVQLKQDLEAGKQVLFSGTGCQVGALYAYLPREYDNLLTIDIVCHGVPSPRFWRDFLKVRQREEHGRVTGVDFRDKTKFGWKAHRETVYIDGKDYSSRVYTKVFYLDTAARPSCFACIYANKNRVGDITIADFWGHEQALPGYCTDNKGISLVMINTAAGLDRWQKACADVEYVECTGYPYRHTNMKRPTLRPDNYDEFWSDYNRFGIELVLKKYAGYEVCPYWKKKYLSYLNKGKKGLKKVLKKMKKAVKK